tara:strand:+ start:11900 stop:12871 length:972 start_codon:yes stop_codon:yes gene_type:complete
MLYNLNMSSSDDAMKSAIKTTFEQHHTEIQRRSEITQQGLHDTRVFSKVADATEYNFKNDDQRFIVFSLSQEAFSPIPVNLKNPAVCVYGAFRTNDEALQYAKEEVLKQHPGVSVFVDETHKWITAAKNASCMTNGKYITDHKTRLLKNHADMLHMNLKEFNDNVSEQKAGESKKKTASIEEVLPNESLGKSHRIHNSLDVRGQTLAVVSFVKDDADVPEFLFQVYACFDKEEDANTYIRNTCGDKVEDHDIDVVSTCQWIHPQNMTYENANKEVFRSDELDRIMKNHKNQPKEVARFKEAMEKDEKETDTTEKNETDVPVLV